MQSPRLTPTDPPSMQAVFQAMPGTAKQIAERIQRSLDETKKTLKRLRDAGKVHYDGRQWRLFGGIAPTGTTVYLIGFDTDGDNKAGLMLVYRRTSDGCITYREASLCGCLVNILWDEVEEFHGSQNVVSRMDEGATRFRFTGPAASLFVQVADELQVEWEYHDIIERDDEEHAPQIAHAGCCWRGWDRFSPEDTPTRSGAEVAELERMFRLEKPTESSDKAKGAQA